MSHNTSQRAQDLAVTITLDEHERRSRAVARLRWRDRTLIGSGPIAYRRQWVTVGGIYQRPHPAGARRPAGSFLSQPNFRSAAQCQRLS